MSFNNYAVMRQNSIMQDNKARKVGKERNLRSLDVHSLMFLPINCLLIEYREDQAKLHQAY